MPDTICFTWLPMRHLGAKQLLGLLHCLAGNDLSYLELHLSEIFKGDLWLWLRCR